MSTNVCLQVFNGQHMCYPCAANFEVPWNRSLFLAKEWFEDSEGAVKIFARRGGGRNFQEYQSRVIKIASK